MKIFSKDQDKWNAYFSMFFVVYLFVLIVLVRFVRGEVPTSLPIFDFVLLSLASFRLIRLFVYDKIFQFLRDYLSGFKTGPYKTLYELMICPWCFGVWAASFIVFCYFVAPIAYFLIVVLAVSGLASFFQLVSNLVGWRAEHSKMSALDSAPKSR